MNNHTNSSPHGDDGPATYHFDDGAPNHYGDTYPPARSGRIDTSSLYRDESSTSSDPRPNAEPARGGITFLGSALIWLFVILIFGLIDVLIDGGFGLILGAVSLLTAFYSALATKSQDKWSAVIMPPIAWFVAAITVGQIPVFGGTGSFFVREALMLSENLAFNALWILASVVLAFVLVLIRMLFSRRTRASARV